MSEAPKTIWATGNETTGSWNGTKLNDRIAPTQHEYTLTTSVSAQLNAADELATDMMITIDNIRDTGRTDSRWDGVAEKLQARLTAYRKAKEQAQ